MTDKNKEALEALDWLQANTQPIIKGQYAIGGKHIKTIRAALSKPSDVDMEALSIGNHVKNGWIAFDGQLFNPDNYKIVEK
jgi:hypothetical protein